MIMKKIEIEVVDVSKLSTLEAEGLASQQMRNVGLLVQNLDSKEKMEAVAKGMLELAQLFDREDEI